MADEFESWMGKMGVSSKKEAKKPVVPRSGTSKKLKQLSPREKHLASTKTARTSKEDPLSLDLESMLQQADVQALKETLAQTEAELQGAKEAQLRLAEENKRLQAQLEHKDTLLATQQTSLVAHEKERESTAVIERELRREIEKKEQGWQQEKQQLEERIVALSHPKEQSSSQRTSLGSLFEARGVSVLEEQTQLLQILTGNSSFWGYFQDSEVPVEPMEKFLQQELHLVGEHVPFRSLIRGTVLSVSADRCELTGGVDIKSATREVITEMLMSGRKKMAIVGVPRAYDGLLRELFFHESIIVSILESSEGEGLDSYDVVVLLQENIVKPEARQNQAVVSYSLTERRLGQILLALSKEMVDIPI